MRHFVDGIQKRLLSEHPKNFFFFLTGLRKIGSLMQIFDDDWNRGRSSICTVEHSLTAPSDSSVNKDYCDTRSAEPKNPEMVTAACKEYHTRQSSIFFWKMIQKWTEWKNYFCSTLAIFQAVAVSQTSNQIRYYVLLINHVIRDLFLNIYI